MTRLAVDLPIYYFLLQKKRKISDRRKPDPKPKATTKNHLQKHKRAQASIPKAGSQPWWQGQEDVAAVIIKKIEQLAQENGPFPGKFEEMSFRLVIPQAKSMERQMTQRLVQAQTEGYGLDS